MKYKYNLGADAALYNQLCTDKKLDPADYNIFYHNSSGGAGRISLHDIHNFFINHSTGDNKIIINTINSDHVSNSYIIERIYNEFYQKITFYKKAIAIIGVMQGDKKIAIEDFNLSAEQQKDIRLETMCCDNLAAGIKHYEKYIKRLSAFIKAFDCVMCLASGAEKSDFTERKKTKVDKIVEQAMQGIKENPCFTYDNYNIYIPFDYMVVDHKKAIHVDRAFYKHDGKAIENIGVRVDRMYHSFTNAAYWKNEHFGIDKNIFTTFVKTITKHDKVFFPYKDTFIAYRAGAIIDALEITNAKTASLGVKRSDVGYMLMLEGNDFNVYINPCNASVDFKRENVFESINYISDQDTPEKADNTPEKPEQVQTPEKAEKQAEKAKTALKTEDVEQVLKTLDLSETWAQSIDLFNAAAKVLHPAHGGNENTWNKLVDKFNYVYDVVKDWHKRPGGSSYRAEMQETASEIVNIIDTINRCKGLDLETVGRFMWCKGSQLDYKKVLTDLGFTYQKDKRKFCKSYKGYKRTGGKGYSYASICRRYAEDTSV